MNKVRSRSGHSLQRGPYRESASLMKNLSEWPMLSPNGWASLSTSLLSHRYKLPWEEYGLEEVGSLQLKRILQELTAGLSTDCTPASGAEGLPWKGSGQHRSAYATHSLNLYYTVIIYCCFFFFLLLQKTKDLCTELSLTWQKSKASVCEQREISWA